MGEAREIDCQAEISVCDNGGELFIQSRCVDEPNSPAVKFAQWICKNASTLMLQMVQSEAKERLGLVEPAHRLLGQDGRPMQ